MKYNPHEYQKAAIEFIETHPISAIFLDMGLGKTSISLTAINNVLSKTNDVRSVLVVAPLRVARDVWPAELEKWDHLQHLTYSTVLGNPSERVEALKQEADIYIINRENLEWLIDKSGMPFKYDMVVIDELSSFKNFQSKRFKALMKVRPRVKRIVGLTGTPAANGLMDLWAEFKILDMGQRLGSYITQYRQAYFSPGATNGAIVYNYRLNAGADEEIYKRIEDITISMKCTDHLKMPELISSRYEVSLSPTERSTYKKMKKQMILSLPAGDVTASNAAILCNKLVQMANGTVYDDAGRSVSIHQQKLNALEDLIEAANGKPVLVAVWFRHDCEQIMKRLNDRHIPCAILDSDVSIAAWNAGKLPVALIHPASAGHGLNLQAGGNTLIWFGLTWSLELYSQTIARLWRQGQNEETVVVQHIITKNTIDEQVMKALHNKDKTQDAMIEAVKYHISSL